MTREPVAVDFMGLGNNTLGGDNKESGRSHGNEADRVTLVKPIASIPEKKPVVGMSRFVTVSETERAVDRENSISRLRQGISSSPLRRVRAPVGGRDEEMQGRILVKHSEKAAFEKPLEELTDSDILLLTREDCRRYLKERGMQKPSWNKQEVVQQIFSLRYHSDPRGEDKRLAKRASVDGPHHIPSPSLSEWEHTMTSSPSHPHVSKEGGLTARFSDVQAHTRTSLFANSFQVPRDVSNTTSQMSLFGEEAQTGAKNSKCAGANSHLSFMIPATHQHQPIVSNVSGFGTPLLAFHGVARTNSTTDRGVAITGQWPSQMQVGNMQGSTLSRLAHTGGMEMKQCTSQLTIFYAGMVNVYDDIPIEKVQAIMLLAGNANTWSSKHTNAPTNVVSSGPFSAPMPVPQPSTASPAPPETTAGAVSSPALPTAGAVSSPAVPTSELLPGLIASALRQPTTRNIQMELPQARKASLARFLEKRKDRVRSKGPYAPKCEGSPTPPCERSPSPPSNKPQSRSQSPAMSSGMQKQLLSPNAICHQCTVTGREANSPTIHSETLLKRITVEDQSTENSAGRDCGIVKVSGAQNGTSCRVSSETRRDEAMTEVNS